MVIPFLLLDDQLLSGFSDGGLSCLAGYRPPGTSIQSERGLRVGRGPG
jgi:hypothetical protein